MTGNPTWNLRDHDVRPKQAGRTDVSKYRVFICGADDGQRVDPNPDCPEHDKHTPQPPGYIQWHEWAGKMARTRHCQRACPGCGLRLIWLPTEPGGEA